LWCSATTELPESHPRGIFSFLFFLELDGYEYSVHDGFYIGERDHSIMGE
jgi:hypothetical protein